MLPVSPSGWLACGDAIVAVTNAARRHSSSTASVTLPLTVRLVCVAPESRRDVRVCASRVAMAFAPLRRASAHATQRTSVDVVARCYDSDADGALGAAILRCDTGALLWAVAPWPSHGGGPVHCVQALMPSPSRVCAILQDKTGDTRLLYAMRHDATACNRDSTASMPAVPYQLVCNKMCGDVRSVAATSSTAHVLVLTSSGAVYSVALPAHAQQRHVGSGKGGDSVARGVHSDCTGAGAATAASENVVAHVVAQLPQAYVTAHTRLATCSVSTKPAAVRRTAANAGDTTVVAYTRGTDTLYVAHVCSLHDTDDTSVGGDVDTPVAAEAMRAAGDVVDVVFVDCNTAVVLLTRRGTGDVTATGLQLLRLAAMTDASSSHCHGSNGSAWAHDGAAVWLQRPVHFVHYSAAKDELYIGSSSSSNNNMSCTDTDTMTTASTRMAADDGIARQLLSSLVVCKVALPRQMQRVGKAEDGSCYVAADTFAAAMQSAAWQRLVHGSVATSVATARTHAMQNKLLLPFLHDVNAGAGSKRGTNVDGGDADDDDDGVAVMTLCYAGVRTCVVDDARAAVSVLASHNACAAIFAVTATAAVHTRLIRQAQGAATTLAYVLRRITAAAAANSNTANNVAQHARTTPAPLPPLTLLSLPWHPRHLRRALRLLTPTQLTLLFHCMTSMLQRTCVSCAARGSASDSDGTEESGDVSRLYSGVATTVASAAVVLVTLARQLGVVLRVDDVRLVVLLLRASRSAAHELLSCVTRMQLVVESCTQRCALQRLLSLSMSSSTATQPTSVAATVALSSTFHGVPRTLAVQPPRLRTRYAVTTWAEAAAQESARHDAVLRAATRYLSVLQHDGLLPRGVAGESGDGTAANASSSSSAAVLPLCSWCESGARVHVDAVFAAFEGTLLQRSAHTHVVA